MLLVLKIIFRILLWWVILIILKKVVENKQTPKDEIIHEESGEKYIDWKTVSSTYMIFGMILSIFFIVLISAPSDLKGQDKWIMMAFFGFLMLFPLVMSYLCGRLYVKIGKEKIYWRKMNGKEYEVKYEDITYYRVVEDNMQIYKENQCILKFPLEGHGSFVMDALMNHKVKRREYNGEKVVLWEKRFNVILVLIFFICSMVMFLMSVYYIMIIGVLLFFWCLAIFTKGLYTIVTYKVIIEGNTIYEKRNFRKKQINFEDVDYLARGKVKDDDVLYIYSKQGTIIQVPSRFRNLDILGSLISKQHWRLKEKRKTSHNHK